jgi:hypothetical protein
VEHVGRNSRQQLAQRSAADAERGQQHKPQYWDAEPYNESPPRDRLKRAAIPLGAIVALSASAVLAQDRLTKDDLATLAATLGVYDSRCETLPPRLRTDLQRMVRLLDKDDLMARGLNEQE